MAIYTAANTADLARFAAKAVSGDVIRLATGTYSGVVLQNLAKAGTVTITSADPNRPAVFTDLLLKNCQNLTIGNVEMSATKDMPFQVLNSSKIVLDKLDVHGTLNGTSGNDARAMLIRDSSNVTVSNSHFHELTDALTHVNLTNATFTGNSFDIIRDNGIAGGGSSFITISKNTFTSFDHTGAVHPDAIQFWTTNTSKGATDITVTGNVFNRGAGTPIQGIFINDDVGTLPYSRVTVSNNVIVGAAYNGIVVQGANDATLTGNMVIGASDQASWLSARNVVAAKVTDNVVTALNNSGSTVTAGGNVLATSVAVSDLSHLTATLSTHVGPSVASAQPAATSYLSKGLFGAMAGDVSLVGFMDGASPTGKTYAFTEVRWDGTSGDDRLTAGAVGASHLYGYDGNDILVGGKNGVVTTMEGGRGDDTYALYQANDVVVEQAGAGFDTVNSYVSYTLGVNIESGRAMAAGLTITGNALDNTLYAAVGGSTLYGGGGNDTLISSTGPDKLYGGDGNDRLLGGDGNDLLDGGAGDDILSGGLGNDTLLGGDGNDMIEGGLGADTMTGGKGADTFLYRAGDFAAGLTASKDIITDFKPAESDVINLSLIDANTRTAAADPFVFIGNQSFHGVAGELRYVAEGDGITVYGDVNGDKTADIGIHLTGLKAITASSFIL